MSTSDDIATVRKFRFCQEWAKELGMDLYTSTVHTKWVVLLPDDDERRMDTLSEVEQFFVGFEMAVKFYDRKNNNAH